MIAKDNLVVNMGYFNGTPVWRGVKPKDTSVPFFIKNLSDSVNTVSIVHSGSDEDTPVITVEKSLDGMVWETMGTTSTTAITATIPVNGTLYLRCTCTRWGGRADIDKNNKIYADKPHSVGGNIMSLLKGENFIGEQTMASSAFKGLFDGDVNLVDASSLILPSQASSMCYMQMFRGCTSLTTAPILPATTVMGHSYQQMFYNCTSLTTAPELPATNLTQYNCYRYMFSGCTSLTTAPTLPATTLVTGCYEYMFSGCTSLTTAPTLPATTLAKSCYSNMFSACRALTKAPELPATNLAENCYYNMFYNCTSLVKAPDLPATKLVSGCYIYMFGRCSSLKEVKCLATNSSSSYCNSWFYNVPAGGTFYKASGSTWASGISGIPDGWTVVEV